MRRPLADTLVDLVESMTPVRAGAAGVRVSSLAIDLPLEVLLTGPADDPVLLANHPRWRWVTEFDDFSGRLAAQIDLDAGP